MHAISLALLILVSAFLIFGLIKPIIFKKYFREFAERKYILAGGVFIGLLCGTIYTATDASYQTYDSSSSRGGGHSTAQPLEEEPALTEEKSPTKQEADADKSDDKQNTGNEKSSNSEPTQPTSNTASASPATEKTVAKKSASPAQPVQSGMEDAKAAKSDGCKTVNLLFVCF